MESDQNEELTRNDIIHALAFAAYLYARIAEETRASSLATSRYATETAAARNTIAAELATSSDARLVVDYDDTPNATGNKLLDQAWSVDRAIITTLESANASAYESIAKGIVASGHRLHGMLHDASGKAKAWQCCVCQQLLPQQLDECYCGASSAALRPVWKTQNGNWYGNC